MEEFNPRDNHPTDQRSFAVKHPPECKCGGDGWVWWDELEFYDGPAIETGTDDTRYSCDAEQDGALQ